MKINLSHPARGRDGYALLISLMFVGIAVVLLVSVMNWTMQTSRLTDRNNEYFTAAAAAEAATEKVLVHVSRDYLQGGSLAVQNNSSSYHDQYPKSSDSDYWRNFTFTDPNTGTPGVYTALSTNWQYTVMDGQYSGLFGYQSVHRIVANARWNNSRNANLSATVQQEIALEAIPLFQFAAFYNMDMEINPSPAMTITGRVHANGNIYTVPSTSLTFASDVTASGFITNTFKPGDPLGGRSLTNPPNVDFKGRHDGDTSALNLPLGTNAASTSAHQILDVPPSGESATSPIGTSRLYNKTDLLILVSDAGVQVTSGVASGKSVTVSNSDWSTFLTTTNIIYNKRESSYVRTVELDVSRFKTWAENPSNAVTPKLSGKSTINSVYVADVRTATASVLAYTTNKFGTVSSTSTSVAVEPGIELKNGSQLPKAGLTVISPDPVYVRGDYNTTSDGVNFSRGSNDTTYTLPAAIMGDAIMVLSTAWADANSGQPLASRVAGDTTVNAAFLGGIVPTGNSHYSGGLENFPRFLENWSGKTLCYNGAMIVMFNSVFATAPWGSNNDTYSPPKRMWAFDTNFYVEAKLPPSTPSITFVERLSWQSRQPGTVSP